MMRLASIGSLSVARHKSAVICLFIYAIAWFACSNPAIDAGIPLKARDSSMLIGLTIDQIIDQSDTILIGTVIGKESFQDTQNSAVYTEIRLTTEQKLKGQPVPATVVIRVPGGETGGIIQQVEDTPSFKIGERVIVFLASGEDGSMMVVGGSQGKGIIENGKVISVVPTLNGLQVETLSNIINEKHGK